MKKSLLIASLLAAGVSAQAQTTFELNYFKQVVADAEGGNVVVSPLSAGMLAGMIANGADGTTLQEMLDVFGESSLQDLNSSLNHSIEYFRSIPNNGTKVDLHNALWMDDALNLKPAFVQNMNESFYAEMNSLDFSVSDALSDINQWVLDNTQGYIPELLNYLDPSTRLVMVNTVFANSSWDSGFDLSDGESIFHNYKGANEMVQMMTQLQSVGYYKNSVYMFELIKVKFEDILEIVFISPIDNLDIKSFVSQMSPTMLQNGLSHMNSELAYLTMPPFDHSTKVDMKKVLKEMGMTEAFGDNANFSQLSDCEDAMIQTAMQKSVITLNEDGIIAASASEGDWVVTDPGDGGEPEIKHLLLNHPFAYLIRDKVTNSTLFMGTVASFNETGHTSIESVHAAAPINQRTYNLQGMPTGEHSGLVIEGGKIKFYR